MSHPLGPVPHFLKLVHALNRGGKRCERCERCLCKDFPTGVKILVKNVIKGGVGKVFFCSKIVFEECYKGWFKNSWKPKVSVTVPVSHSSFALFPCVLHCFLVLYSFLTFLVLNLSQIMHFG